MQTLQNQKRIQQILKWNPLMYFTFMHEMGLAYLQAYIPGDPQGIACLERSKIFWSWWRNHWAIRDKEFLSYYELFSDNSLVAMYQHEHCPERLVSNIYPHAAVLGDSYAQMIGNFNKSETI